MNGATDPFVLAFGDSLTAGYGLARADAFPAQLERLLRRSHPGATVWNAGVSGDTTRSGLARLPRLLSDLPRRPDLAIVELGANDMLRLVDPAVTRANLDAIIAMFASRTIPVLVAGMLAPPLLGPVALRFNAIHPEMAVKHGAALYPFFLAGAMGSPDLTLRDGIHPSAKAVGIIAGNILPVVQDALASATSVAA